MIETRRTVQRAGENTLICVKNRVFFAFDHEDSSVLDVQQAPISCFNGFLLMFSELSNAMKMGTLSKSG
uniref:Uncharacterized protein n=1 Tax=Helianthus annuus TaxID=4232 RepID=A0A251THE7_HELAN